MIQQVIFSACFTFFILTIELLSHYLKVDRMATVKAVGLHIGTPQLARLLQLFQVRMQNPTG